MANFLMYHTSYSTLAQDIKNLIAGYNAKEISEKQLQEVVLGWSDACPNFLFDTEDGKKKEPLAISPGLLRHIGKKRGVVIFKAYEDAPNKQVPNAAVSCILAIGS